MKVSQPLKDSIIERFWIWRGNGKKDDSCEEYNFLLELLDKDMEPEYISLFLHTIKSVFARQKCKDEDVDFLRRIFQFLLEP